ERLRGGRGRLQLPGGGRRGVPLVALATDSARRLGRHGDRVPAHAAAVVRELEGGEDMGAERPIRVGDLDRHLENRNKALPHEDLLLSLADKDRDLAGLLDRLIGAIAGRRRLVGLSPCRLPLFRLATDLSRRLSGRSSGGGRWWRCRCRGRGLSL